MFLSIPDGNSKIVVENEVDRRILNLGTQYNFIFGKIRYWASYGMPLGTDILKLEATVSDDIGYGRIYYDTTYLERARTGLAGLHLDVFKLGLFGSVGRTDWHLAQFENPGNQDAGKIDSAALEATPAPIFSIFSEYLEPESSFIRYRHAFRQWGGDFQFDKVEGDITWGLPPFRRRDESAIRVMAGQSVHISPHLPLRETFALGGGGALKGFRYEEFRGSGIAMTGVEYGLRTPYGWSNERWKFGLTRNYLLFFMETGRIEEGWFKPAMSLKWSTGLGLKLKGFLGERTIILRGYLAQAVPVTHRAVVWYFMFDLK